MKASHLGVLCCPQCRGDLSIGAGTVVDAEDILTGSLICHGCPATYPITAGVPTFSTELTTPDSERQTVSAFGFQWTRFRRQDGLMSSEELFDMFLPSGITFESKSVLEAGCGTGRWIPIVVRRGARIVIGVDLSEAAYVAYDNTRRLKNVLILRASISSLPLREKFDLVYAIGVLHHMPDPRKGVEALGAHLGQKGALAAWVYSREGNEAYLAIAQPFRRLIQSWPSQLKLIMSYPIAAILAIVLPMWSVTTLPMSKYAGLLRRLSYRDLVNVVNDQLAPSISHYLTRSQVESWGEGTGMRIEALSMRTENSWRVLLRKG